MKVLFIGATGLVGSQVVPVLQENFELTLAAKGGGEIGDLPVIDLDITDWEAIESLIAAGASDGEPFDAVVNCAIASYRGTDRHDPDGLHRYNEQCIEVNARGAYHVYEAAARADVPRVVYIGSMTAVLGRPRYEAIDLESRERPNNVYAACKIFGEHVGRTYAYPQRRGRRGEPVEEAEPGMHVLCLRLGQPFPSFSHFDEKWLEHPRARGLAVHVHDIARAIECSLHADVQYGVYSIVSASDVPFIDPELYAEIGYEPKWKFTPEGLVSVDGSQEPMPLVIPEIVTRTL